MHKIFTIATKSIQVKYFLYKKKIKYKIQIEERMNQPAPIKKNTFLYRIICMIKTIAKILIIVIIQFDE